MMKPALLSCAVLAASALPASAQGSDEMRTLVAAFQAGQPVDGQRLVALVEEAAGTGLIQTGIYGGTLQPITGPVEMTAPRVVTLACTTNVVSTIPVEGFPPTYAETTVLTREADGVGSVLYETVDDVSVLRMEADWDEGGFDLGRIYMDDQFGELELVQTPDGGLRDELSGAIFPPSSEDAQLLTGLVDAIVDVNPSWQVTSAELTTGSRWLVPGREDDLLNALSSLVGSSLGIPGAQVSENFVITAVTGATEVDGAPSIVFEIIMDVDVTGAGMPQINVRITSVEVYEIATFARQSMSNVIALSAPGISLDITQDQDCRLSADG